MRYKGNRPGHAAERLARGTASGRITDQPRLVVDSWTATATPPAAKRAKARTKTRITKASRRANR